MPSKADHTQSALGDVFRGQGQTLQARKLLFLFPYFNIPYGDWEQLARAIALAFVPGLKIEDGAPLKKGAPIRWTPEAYQTLLREVSEAAGSNPGLSDRRLVLKMVKSDPEKWNAKRGDTKDIARVRDNLCKRLSDAKALTEQTK